MGAVGGVLSVAARSRGTFELLWCWLNGEVLYESPAEMLSEQHRLALTSSVRRTRYGFALVVERNWRWEEQTREVHLNGPALRELWKLPEGAAVDRLLGYDDGPTWRPGIAGLEPQEARALRFTVVTCWAMPDIQRQTGMKPGAVYKARSEARKKLRVFFGMPARPAKEREMPEFEKVHRELREAWVFPPANLTAREKRFAGDRAEEQLQEFDQRTGPLVEELAASVRALREARRDGTVDIGALHRRQEVALDRLDEVRV